MAIYHCKVASISKSSGQSAAAHCAYIERIGKYAKSRDQADFSMSGNLPSWAATASEFWSAADEFERANGSVAKKIMVALPQGSNLDSQTEMVNELMAGVTGEASGPLVWSAAIHDSKSRNPHVHIVFSERVIDGVDRDKDLFFKRANKKHPERGGAAKDRQLCHTTKDHGVNAIRKCWETTINKHLAAPVSRLRKSIIYAKMGKVAPPRNWHRGPQVTAMEARGIETERTRKHRAWLKSVVPPKQKNTTVIRIANEAERSHHNGLIAARSNPVSEPEPEAKPNAATYPSQEMVDLFKGFGEGYEAKSNEFARRQLKGELKAKLAFLKKQYDDFIKEQSRLFQKAMNQQFWQENLPSMVEVKRIAGLPIWKPLEYQIESIDHQSKKLDYDKTKQVFTNLCREASEYYDDEKLEEHLKSYSKLFDVVCKAQSIGPYDQQKTKRQERNVSKGRGL